MRSARREPVNSVPGFVCADAKYREEVPDVSFRADGLAEEVAPYPADAHQVRVHLDR